MHPALQNDALMRLQQTFPNVQFIVSTHSPLLLNGLRKEQVHILSLNAEGQRIVSNPDEDIIGLGANEILTTIFGLNTTMDGQFIEWDTRYKELFKKKKENELTESETAEFENLSKRLSPLRLDPTLIITSEDPIAELVKEKLAVRFSAKSNNGLSQINERILEKEVGEILNGFFKTETE